MARQKNRTKTGGIVKGLKHSGLVDKAKVIGMLTAGISYTRVTKETGVSRGSAHRWMQSLKQNSSLDRSIGSGRPRKTSPEQDSFIVLQVKRNREITSTQLRKENSAINISDKTIRRRIHELTDLRSHWKIKKPFICARNRRLRVRWCMDCLHWTRDNWHKFLWSDESPFVLRFCQKTRVWRAAYERHCSFAMRGTVKHDVKINVWGCFSAHGVGNCLSSRNS